MFLRSVYVIRLQLGLNVGLIRNKQGFLTLSFVFVSIPCKKFLPRASRSSSVVFAGHLVSWKNRFLCT